MHFISCILVYFMANFRCTVLHKMELSVTKHCIKNVSLPIFHISPKKEEPFTAPYCYFQHCNIIESMFQKFG